MCLKLQKHPEIQPKNRHPSLANLGRQITTKTSRFDGKTVTMATLATESSPLSNK